jgi:sec-independent protein translocase protein TatA
MTNHLLFLGGLGTGEIIVICLVILLLFGGKKIPELMRGLGKGVNSFKQGMNEIEKDITAEPTPKKEETYNKDEKQS